MNTDNTTPAPQVPTQGQADESSGRNLTALEEWKSWQQGLSPLNPCPECGASIPDKPNELRPLLCEACSSRGAKTGGKIEETTQAIEEGDTCPKCQDGQMKLFPVENCSCHISPPCNACVENPLTCDKCGWVDETEAP